MNINQDNSNEDNIKKVKYDPDLSFDNLNFNVEKDSIVQELDFDMNNFEKELDNIKGGGGSSDNDSNFNNIELDLSNEKKEEINEKFNTLQELDKNMNNNVNEQQQEEKQDEPTDMNYDELNSLLNSDEHTDNHNDNHNEDGDDDDNEDDDEIVNQDGGTKSEKSSKIDLDISNFNDIIHPLVNINNVKKLVNEWIKNIKSKLFDKYLSDVSQMYQKNVKKYYVKRDNNKIVLYNKSTNTKMKQVKIPEIRIINDEKELLNKEILILKHKLIGLYLTIKHNKEVKENYELEYNKTLNLYKKHLELLTAYLLYDNLINQNTHNLDNNDDNDETVNQEDTSNEDKSYIFLSNTKETVEEDSKVYIENKHYLIPNTLKQSLQELNKIKNQQYINLLKSFKDNNKDKKDKAELKNKIKEYLNKSDKTLLVKKINQYKNKQSRIIKFAILSI